MIKCPNCKTELDHLDFDVTAGCSSQIYLSDIKKGNYTDYDIDCLTEDVVFDNFRCPECSHKISDTEEEAREFLKKRK